jgi:hypothetical protein
MRPNKKYENSNSISPIKWIACELASASLEIWNAGGIANYTNTLTLSRLNQIDRFNENLTDCAIEISFLIITDASAFHGEKFDRNRKWTVPRKLEVGWKRSNGSQDVKSLSLSSNNKSTEFL